VNIIDLLRQLATDNKLVLIGFLILADLILGVLAALRNGTFSLARIGDFLRADVLGKVLPWAALYLLDKAAHGANVALGVDTGDIAMVAYGAANLALVGSLTSSIADLGVKLPDELAVGEHTTPA
jgi:hypothetical protein